MNIDPQTKYVYMRASQPKTCCINYALYIAPTRFEKITADEK
jgi:hypothetical protein